MAQDIIQGEVKALVARHIDEDTCRLFNYRVGEKDGQVVQLANYMRDGKIIAQKIRTKDKKFLWRGDEPKNPGLFGQNLWRDGGRKVVITEGEIDALTVSQLQGNKWPVVSVPNGAPNAAKDLSKQIEWLEKFEQVVFMFDMDEPGREAAKECALLLTPGKAFIADLPLKDANEMLKAGRGKEVIDAMWGAKAYRPDGIVSISDIMAEIKKPIEYGLPWCFPTLTALTYGRHYGAVYGLGAGTGVGKTDVFTQQIAYDTTVLNLKVGVFYLEQKPVETGKRIAGKVAQKRFHVPDAGWTAEEQDEALLKIDGKVYFYDSFGETEWDVVKAKMRYLAVAHKIRLFYLDHLTAMADTENERESLEQIMKEMAGLANELGLIIHFVSHLSTPEGKSHEEGGRVMIKHFKGSRSIGFWSHYMFGLERDQQAENEKKRKITTFRVLKDRYTGQATGRVFGLDYDEATGMLTETELESFGFEDETGDGKRDF